MSELLPCPFCNGETCIERAGTRRQSTVIACTECGARHESSDQDGHVGESWSRRANVSAAGGAEPVAWLVRNKETKQEWASKNEPEIPVSQTGRYEYFPLVYAHSSVAGMPDEQIHAIAVKWAQSNFRVGVLEIEYAIKEAVRALGGA